MNQLAAGTDSALSELGELPASPVVGLEEFLTMQFPPQLNLLSPWLPQQGLAMIHAPRGVGKTYLGLSIGLAVAYGGEVLGWAAPNRAGVLYVDGEMTAPEMQKRLAAAVSSMDAYTETASFDLMTPDLSRKYGIPDISQAAGRDRIDECLSGDVKLIILDNLSSLTSGDENDSAAYEPVQKWFLNHRSAGRAVLLIHHSGKKGGQRGTSRREDNLDTVIALRRPRGYKSADGARFEVHFEKNRLFFGNDVRPFEAQLLLDSAGLMSWSRRPILTNSYVRTVELHRKGMTPSEISAELGIDKSTVSRNLKKLRERESLGG